MRLAAGALLIGLTAIAPSTQARTIGEIQPLVSAHLQRILPANGAGGAAVAIRAGSQTLFFNYGFADIASKRPITSDSLFNLASLGKVLDTTLLALAAERNEIKLEDPISKYVTELGLGGDIRRVTVGQLATHTSGLLLPQDHPPWPETGYTLPAFLHTLNGWRAHKDHEPGKLHTYTHAGFILLHLALERRFSVPLATLIEQRILRPLGMNSTSLPVGGKPRGELPAALRSRAVQGYAEDGAPIGEPGDIQGYYHWPGTGQAYSSARDMARFIAANLGESTDPNLSAAIAFAQRAVFPMEPHVSQALAWEVNDNMEVRIIEKNGGLNNTSGYIGVVPSRKLGIVILCNRGEQNTTAVGRAILIALVRQHPSQRH
jgi:beta-lactamase class C